MLAVMRKTKNKSADARAEVTFVCRLTTQVVHLLLLQQAAGVVVSLQHQLRLRKLAGHSLAPEGLLRLDPVILFSAWKKER